MKNSLAIKACFVSSSALIISIISFNLAFKIPKDGVLRYHNGQIQTYNDGWRCAGVNLSDFTITDTNDYIDLYHANEPLLMGIYSDEVQILEMHIESEKLIIKADPNNMNEAAQIFFNQYLKPIADNYIERIKNESNNRP